MYKKKSLSKGIVYFFSFFLGKNRFPLLLYVLLCLATGLWGPLNGVLTKKIINLLPRMIDGNIDILVVPGVLVVVNFIFFDHLTWRMLTYIRAKFLPALITQASEKLIEETLKQPYGFYQKNMPGKIARQITNLSDSLERLISAILPNFLRGISLLFTAFVTAYIVNSIFFFVLIIWFFLFAVVSFFMSQKLVKLSHHQAHAESNVIGEMVDCLSNHHNVGIFCATTYGIHRIKPLLLMQQKSYTCVHMYSLAIQLIQGALIATMMGVVMYYLIYLYGKNLVTIGDFALILGLFMETGHMIWFTMPEVDELNKIVGRCKQSLALLILNVIENSGSMRTDKI
jgi:ATP-binding cassette subfamily B protein